jgi:hypothetical protein
MPSANVDYPPASNGQQPLVLNRRLLHAGAPPNGRNLFCDPSTNMCFNMSTTFKTYTAAEADCQAMTGQLVMYTSAAKQLMVEQVGITS